jgi:roadblock/LC7 domain-containing protein
MTTKVQTLFDLGKLEKRKTPTEQKFQDDNADLLNVFKDAVDYAFEMLHKKVFTVFKANAMDRNLPAVSVISFIKEYLIDKVPEHCRLATEGRFKLVTKDGQCIYVKKLDEKKMPSNISTTANDMIMHQFTASEYDAGGNVFFGYTTDEGYPKPTGIYAVCIDGNQKVWIFDIATIIKKAQSPVIKLTTKANKPKLKEGVVKIKKDKRKNI